MGLGIGIGIGAYLALMGVSYGCAKFFDKAYSDKIKRLGYISTEPELYGAEANLTRITDALKTLLFLMTPLLNLFPIFLLFGFEKTTDSMIMDEKQEGRLRKVGLKELEAPKDEVGYLERRIEEVRKFQEQMGHKNIPRTFSELSYDEKIDMLLHELELAYMEKASAEGIDLSARPALLENNESKKLKKTL